MAKSSPKDCIAKNDDGSACVNKAKARSLYCEHHTDARNMSGKRMIKAPGGSGGGGFFGGTVFRKMR